MAHEKYILIAVLVLAVLSLAGCGESNNRTNAANRRWERVMERARIDAAQQGIEQGRLEFARMVLEDLVESDSAFSEETELALVDLRVATEQFAAARNVDAAVDDSFLLN